VNLTYHKNLDGIRAIAALMVMVFHFFGGIESNSIFLKFLSKVAVFGQSGVTLFFVLSGFLITRILLYTKGKSNYFKAFYLRRTLRIFPLYYFFLLIYYWGYPLLFHSQGVPITEQIPYYTYLQNIAITFNWKATGPNHFWSLAVEEQFYLIWPLIVFLFSEHQLLKIIFSVVVGSFLLRIWMINEHYDVFYFTFTRIDALVIGALLSLWEKNGMLEKKGRRFFLMLSAGILLPTMLLWTFVGGQSLAFIQACKYFLLAMFYFALIGWILNLSKENYFNKVLCGWFLNYTGKISYGLYIYHPFAYVICKKWLFSESWILSFLISWGVSYVMASVSYYLIESNFLKLKRFFEYK